MVGDAKDARRRMRAAPVTQATAVDISVYTARVSKSGQKKRALSSARVLTPGAVVIWVPSQVLVERPDLFANSVACTRCALLAQLMTARANCGCLAPVRD
ncbi:hypothetical protein MRX96_030743 [Rhipicephalus microplus]